MIAPQRITLTAEGGASAVIASAISRYTYGQPVPGSIRVHVCQPPQQNYGSRNSRNISPCDTKTKQLALDLNAVVEEEGTGYAVDSSGSNIPDYKVEELLLSELLPPSLDTQSVSSLELKKNNTPLPCDEENNITVQYTIVKEAQGTVDVIYLGEVSFKLRVSADMAPDVQVVAYAVLPSENVIAHSSDFKTEKCFNNKVSLEFSPSSGVPGEETKLQLTAQPDSLCGVSAIDQSVLIKEPGKTLNADKIFNLLPVKRASGVPHHIEDTTECLHVRPKRFLSPSPHGQDAYTVFKKMGLKIATNLLIRRPTCLSFQGDLYHRNVVISLPRRFHWEGNTLRISGFRGLTPPPPVQTTRTFFPETWIWDLVEVGSSGTKDVSLTVPDTITTWETETFCLSSEGFGLAPRQKLTVFQPFFLELTLPYSIIRGENFELKATVFNYLTSCIMMKVIAAPSSDYTLTPLSGDQYTSCLCGNERKTLSWTMTPTALGVVNVTVSAEAVPSHASCDNEVVSVPERGRIDTVKRSLRVKAEGAEIINTENWLLCPKGETLTEETEMELPENVIDGSVRALVSVLGDILGRALKNLDGLLKMPYGCGEQNMALLAPNIYILHYLKNTQQLTPAIKEKAFKFLSSGYQRQLNYKHLTGAYSNFGSGPGNTWLTSFVLRSFFKAQSFIYIDPSKIEESRTWLNQQQMENGCFRKSGKLFNNRMKTKLIEICRLVAQSKLSEGKHEEALPAAHCLLYTSIDVHGPNTIQLIPAYLLLAEANMGLDNLAVVGELLSQAEWAVLKSPESGPLIQHQLHRSLGRFHTSAGNLQEALYHFANDIYFASEEYGLDSITTSKGYFLMADMFVRQGKMLIGRSLYSKVAQTWHNHLSGLLKTHVKILQNCAVSSDSFYEKSQQVEMDEMLRAMLEFEQKQSRRDAAQTALLAHCLAMLWLLRGDFQKVLGFGSTALQASQQIPKHDLTESILGLLQQERFGTKLEQTENAQHVGTLNLEILPSTKPSHTRRTFRM
ncbi:hypothetical protein CRENBAI_005980 [Crenichthys baileyi]|uniref:Uncharacterized protein n=1 Tax=Crenichthys baileyi TaxID=28760 RepID=A0AAV9SJ17_9TELE